MPSTRAGRTKGGRGSDGATIQESNGSTTGDIQPSTSKLATVVAKLTALGKVREHKFAAHSVCCNRSSFDGRPCVGSGIISRGGMGYIVNKRPICWVCGRDLASTIDILEV